MLVKIFYNIFKKSKSKYIVSTYLKIRILYSRWNELPRSPEAAGRGIKTENGFLLCHSGLSRILFKKDSEQVGMTNRQAGMTTRNDNLYHEAKLRGIL